MMKLLLGIALLVIISGCETRYMTSIENRSDQEIFIAKTDDIMKSYKIAPKTTRIINWNANCQVVGVDFEKYYLNTSESSREYLSSHKNSKISFHVYFESDHFFIRHKDKFIGQKIQETESCKST